MNDEARNCFCGGWAEIREMHCTKPRRFEPDRVSYIAIIYCSKCGKVVAADSVGMAIARWNGDLQ